MRQATASALDDQLREGVARVRRADLLVGIPSFNNAGTVGHVARTVAAGLRTHFPDVNAVIVNADGGSRDGTSDVIASSTDGVPTITGAYVGPPGKGSAFRAIFEVAAALGGANVWDTDVARFGIDIYMTTSALVRGRRVVQAFLGAKIHDPKDPGADLAPMFTQVVSTALRLAVANADAWRDVRGSRPTEIVGSIDAVEPEAVNASVEILERKFAAGRLEHGRTWDAVLREPVPDRIDDGAWAGIVYDFLLATKQKPEEAQGLAGALVPLYFARVASFI